VFESRVLRNVFGRKREEVTEDWRKLRNDEHNNLYFSSNIVRINSRKIIRAGNVARMGKKAEILVENPEGKRLIVTRHKYGDNDKMYLKMKTLKSHIKETH
jgi:hypothetical protein